MSRRRLIVDLFRFDKRLSFSRGEEIQRCLTEKYSQTTDGAALIVAEFEPVYTCGLRRSSSIVGDSQIERLRSLGADFHRTDRGGLLTFHGPGQLVAYPILPLRNHLISLTLRQYIDRLEQSLVETCRHILQAERVFSGTENGRAVNYAGVWIDNQRKVAFLGVRYSRGLTSHGISINCSVNMNWFDHIVPCGFDRKQITSLTDETTPKEIITIEQVQPIFLESFQNIFHVDLIRRDEKEIFS